MPPKLTPNAGKELKTVTTNDMEKTTSPLDAIRTFYIANDLLKKVTKSKRLNKTQLIQELKRVTREANRMSDKKLLNYHLDNYHPRYDNYVNSEWELKTIRLDQCGVWPRMGGLPDAATRGSVVDTAAYVEKKLKGKRLTKKDMRAKYIEKMTPFAELITEHVPLIVIEDGVIRHNKLIPISQSKKYEHCKYDIDDGNHRAVALALLGKTEVKALVGKRIYKSPLIYN